MQKTVFALAMAFLLAGVMGSRARAQTNFYSTNTVAASPWSVAGTWTTNQPAGGVSVAPLAGGSNDYTIVMQAGAILKTNDLGTAANGGFQLNQLIFTVGTSLTGSGLVFMTSSTGALPQLLRNSTAVMSMDNDLVLSNTLTLAGSAVTANAGTLGGVISGTGGLILNGPYTITLTNGNNSFSGPLIINTGTLAATGGGNVLGAGTGAVTLGSLSEPAIAVLQVTATTDGNTTFTIGNLTNAGSAILRVLSVPANSTNILNAGNLARVGPATLVVTPQNSLGTRDVVTFTGGAITPVNGMLGPWIVDSKTANYVTYNGGLTDVVYDATQTGDWDATKKISITGAAAVNQNTNVYALRVGSTVTLSPDVVLSNASGGFIFSNGSLSGVGTVAVGSVELLAYTDNTGTIAPVISGSGGLTKFGIGTLVISNLTYTGATWINQGTLTVASSADRTYSGIINGVGTFSVAGANTLTLTGTNTSLVGLVVNAGLKLDGAQLTVAGSVTFGATGASLAMTNGGQLLANPGLTIGVGAGNSYNTVSVSAASMLLAGATGSPNNINLGNNATAGSNTLAIGAGAVVDNVSRFIFGGWGNSLVVSNGGQLLLRPGVGVNEPILMNGSFGNITIGGTNPVTGALSTISIPVTSGGGQFYIGGNSGTPHDNTVTVGAGGLITNLTIYVGGEYGGSANNVMIVTNGGTVLGGFSIASPGNQTGLSLSNRLYISGTGSVWTATGGSMNVGRAGNGGGVGNNVTYGNGLWIEAGGLLTNEGTVSIGGGGTNSTLNWMVLTNGAKLFSSGSATIGASVPANFGTSLSNSVTIVGGPVGDSIWSLNNGSLTVGGGRATNNVLIVGEGGILTNISHLTLGTTNVSANNSVLINGGSVFLTGFVTNGGFISTFLSTDNSILVTDRGLLEANTLANGAGSGNTISNVGGIYQFTTNSPTINPNGNVIAITNGTVSFRGITNANVWGSLGGIKANGLTNIVFAGDNTFRLNAASNTTAVALDQTYTFQTGVSSNYARLEMINGQTVFRNGNLTVADSGSMLLSNTTGVISGLFTNQGSLSFVNANATFVSQVYNGGTNTMLNSVGTFNSGVINMGRWLTDPTTNVYQGFGYTNMISGVMSMSAGDVYVFTNTPGGATANFINVSTNNVANNLLPGKMLFSGGLGLTQNFTVAGHDLGPGQVTPLLSATNTAAYGHVWDPIPGFTNNFALGTLEISNFSTVRVTDAFLGVPGLGDNDGLPAALYLDNLIMYGNSYLIISTNVHVYFFNSNTWTSANVLLEGNPLFNNALNGLHQLVAVPEPGVLVLWLSGLATVYAARRRGNRRTMG